jgi:hypothetical protein
MAGFFMADWNVAMLVRRGISVGAISIAKGGEAAP